MWCARSEHLNDLAIISGVFSLQVPVLHVHVVRRELTTHTACHVCHPKELAFVDELVLYVLCSTPRRQRVGSHELEEVPKQGAAPIDKKTPILIRCMAKAPCKKRLEVLALRERVAGGVVE